MELRKAGWGELIADAQQREEIIMQMAAEIVQAYRYFRSGLPARAERFEAQSSPGKIGRNDPCPCGSGKKYMRCCGAATIN